MLYTTLHRAGLSAHLEEGSSWSIEKPKSRPADILVANWDRGFSAAFDVSVTSPLNPLHIVEVGISPGAAAKATEKRKHRNNDAKCEELGWRCIPMVVESYCCWGTELVSSLDADEECAEILLQAWYLDNGALAGTRSVVLRALHLIEELGPALGLHVNLAKCEMFSRRGNTSFPPEHTCPASLLAIGQATPKPKMLAKIYGRLNMSLVRSVAMAIMGRVNVRIDVTKHPSSFPAPFGKIACVNVNCIINNNLAPQVQDCLLIGSVKNKSLLSLLADSAVEQTATVYKVPDRDEYLRHLLDHLKETPQQQSSNAMASTIQMVLWRRTQVDFYTDGWPQFTSIAARIRSPTVADVILFTSRKERLLELLRDDLILRCPGSHNNGGVIISGTEASLAEYLMKNMKSRDGEQLLNNIASAQNFQMSKDTVMSFSERTLICPEGYNIGVLRPKDAEFIHPFWNKSLLDSSKDSIKAFQFMIGSLPTSAIFHTSDPENPVAWILTYPFGQIGHLYVLKEHRRKGLAGIVMADLCKKVNGTVPDVMSNNEHAIRAAKAIGFVECGQCIRLIYTCTKRSRLVSIKDALLRWPDTSQDEYAHRLESCHE
ncbi:hypothetical protein EMCRGX_G026729 [Ephydatia muelleri]